MKKTKLFMTILLMGLFMLWPNHVKANELQVLFLAQVGEIKEEPNDESIVIGSLDTGEAVIILEETNEDWYKVQSGEQIGYIRKDALTEVDSIVTQQIKEQAQEDEMRLREAEYQIQQNKQSRIWGIVIVLLVIAIFATGIITTIRQDKAKKSKE